VPNLSEFHTESLLLSGYLMCTVILGNCERGLKFPSAGLVGWLSAGRVWQPLLVTAWDSSVLYMSTAYSCVSKRQLTIL
jgi:hypothetical protein